MLIENDKFKKVQTLICFHEPRRNNMNCYHRRYMILKTINSCIDGKFVLPEMTSNFTKIKYLSSICLKCKVRVLYSQEVCLYNIK